MADQATTKAAEFLAEEWRADDGTIACRCCDHSCRTVEELADHLASADHLEAESDRPEVERARAIWMRNLNPEWEKRGIWPHLG